MGEQETYLHGLATDGENVTQSDLSVQLAGGGKVFAPNPNDLLARTLRASVDARQGGLLLELHHAGRVAVQGLPASLPLSDGGSLKPLLQVSVRRGALGRLTELIIVTEDVCLLDVILLFILSKIKLLLHPAVSVPATGRLLGVFLRAAGGDGIGINGKPVSGQSPPPPPKRLAWGGKKWAKYKVLCMKNILNCWGILSHLNFLGSIFLIYRIWRIWIVKPSIVFPGFILFLFF